MNQTKLQLFTVPNAVSNGCSLSTDAVIDRIGTLFETVHSVFDRCPEDFEILSEGAVYIPFLAVESTGKKEFSAEQEEVLKILCENLELSFGFCDFLNYIKEGKELKLYSKTMKLFGECTDSFWIALGRDCSEDEWNTLLTAFGDIYEMFGGEKKEAALNQLCMQANLARMEQYCTQKHTAFSVYESLCAVYEQVMANSGMAKEEQMFSLSAMIYDAVYTIAGDAFTETAQRLPALLFPPEMFLDMLADPASALTLEDMFACTERSAGSFWKTMYASADQSDNDILVALTAAYLEALLTAVIPPICADALAEHRRILLRIVM